MTSTNFATPEGFVTELLVIPAMEQPDWLAQNSNLLAETMFADTVVELLKDETEKWLRISVNDCQRVIDTIQQVAVATGQPYHGGLAWLAQGNLNALGRGTYHDALDALSEATTAFVAADRVVEQARVIIPKVIALVRMGHYDQAEKDGAWARQIFIDNGEYEWLAILILNLSTLLYMRRGNDAKALQLLDESAGLIEKHLGRDHVFLDWIQHNKATSYRNLGLFNKAIEASNSAIEKLTNSGHTAEAVRARQNLAITYFIIGRYNEALQIFEDVKAFWLKDGRQRDAIMVELFVSDGLLGLYRFQDVIEKSSHIRRLFTEQGIQGEVAQATVNQARAHAGLKQYKEALDALNHAEKIYKAEDNPLAVHIVQLERAAIYNRREAWADGRAAAQICVDYFDSAELPVLKATAHLVMAQAALGQNNLPAVETQLKQVEHLTTIPTLVYRTHLLRGDWHAAMGDVNAALISYDKAMDIVELLKGRLMVEFRVAFADHTVAVYEKAAALSIELEQFERALHYAERAKSRALLDLIAYRIDLSIQAHQDSDLPIINELTRLRRERDRLYRLLGSSEDLRVAGTQIYNPFWQETRDKIVEFEQQITTLWHQLLIRNADYAHDAALWQISTAPAQARLADDTLLLEFFEIDESLIVFQVTNKGISATRLDTDIRKIDHWIRFFKMNCERTVPNKHKPTMLMALREQADGILYELYNCLLAPIIETVRTYQHLIIVPHGSLHHLPFHALYNGTHYLTETHIINYLPNSTLLNHIKSPQNTGTFVAFGYSSAQQLPFINQEVTHVSNLMNGVSFLDENATLQKFYEVSRDAHVLHLAAHGEFNPHNPLFSGVTLADGQLVTMDIFNLKLNASLITLSACQTGRNVISQGDELLGLVRGFLSAGAASLILSHWSVEDRSTAALMALLYAALKKGMPKGAALRDAQLHFISGNIDAPAEMKTAYAHPYFWAPFFLIGDAGAL